MAPEGWYVVLAVGDGESRWPELPLGRSRRQLVQKDTYKAVSYHFLSLSTAEIAGSWCDSMQCLASVPS